MSSARFKLDAFEGPLDLLLQLINKHKLNIYDIEITVLLEQYMEFINNLDHEDYDDAADFLEMAARLIYIKTCSLLPHDEEAQTLKKELEGAIIEYSLCKKAAETLKEQYVGGDIFVRKPVKLPVNKTYSREHDSIVLYDAYMGLSEKARKAKPLKADIFEPIVSHKIVSVTSKIIYVLKRLYKSGEFDMAHLYDGMNTKSERVATFLAVLELTKSGRIFLNDDNSKIFFNSASKNKKVKSDFDKDTFAESKNEIREEPYQPVPLEEIPQPHESEDENFQREEPSYEKFSDYVPKKVLHKSLAERADAVACSVEISDSNVRNKDIDEIPADETNEITADYDLENEQMETENLHNENKLNTNSDKDYAFELEQLVLAGLSSEPPKTVFKPNYWNSLLYYWGFSPVGDDSRENCWKYGRMRLK